MSVSPMPNEDIGDHTTPEGIVRLWDGRCYPLSTLEKSSPLLAARQHTTCPLTWRPSFAVHSAIFASLQRNLLLFAGYCLTTSRPMGEIWWLLPVMTAILFAYYAWKGRMAEPFVCVDDGVLSWTRATYAPWNGRILPINVWQPLSTIHWRVVQTFADHHRILHARRRRAIRLYTHVANRWYSPFWLSFTLTPRDEDFEVWLAFLRLTANERVWSD
jgi:hypothetical protein